MPHEHVQVLDWKHHEGGILVAFIDSVSGAVIAQAVPDNYALVKSVIDFLQRSWRCEAPEVLAVDNSPVFQTKKFRSFMEDEGVKLRILSPADVHLRRKLESTFFQRAAV